jgi:hypothetical protein
MLHKVRLDEALQLRAQGNNHTLDAQTFDHIHLWVGLKLEIGTGMRSHRSNGVLKTYFQTWCLGNSLVHIHVVTNKKLVTGRLRGGRRAQVSRMELRGVFLRKSQHCALSPAGPHVVQPGHRSRPHPVRPRLPRKPSHSDLHPTRSLTRPRGSIF